MDKCSLLSGQELHQGKLSDRKIVASDKKGNLEQLKEID
jgi:hypothetical protein